MARYIDADALYRDTERRIKEANSHRMAVVDDEFLDLINDAFTEDVAPKIEWISVDDKLPEKSGEYLTWHNGSFHLIEYNADLHGWNISHHADRSTEIKSVTHWTPLPEPPEKREPDCRDCRYFVGCECFSGTPCCDLSKAENRKDEKDG